MKDFTVCRYNDCDHIGNKQYEIRLEENPIVLYVPELWKHSAQVHKFQPSDFIRKLVMDANPKFSIVSQTITPAHLSISALHVMDVRQYGNGRYSHAIGNTIDLDFVTKLEKLLSTEPEGDPGTWTPGFKWL